MKKVETSLREYASSISDESLKYLYPRLSQRLSGDLPEALDVLSLSQDMDRWLGAAKSNNELFDIIDEIEAGLQREVVKRFGEAA